MRIADIQELFEGYKREGIDPAPYYWLALISSLSRHPHCTQCETIGSPTKGSMAHASTGDTGWGLR